MLITTKHLLAQNKVLPAFNFGTLEVARSIVAAAEDLQSPFIFEVNKKELEFMGPRTIVAIVESFSEFNKVRFSLHLDHNDNAEQIVEMSELGFSSGMLDISEMSSDVKTRSLEKLRQHLPKDFVLEVCVGKPNQALWAEEMGAQILAVETENYSDLSALSEVRKLTKLPFVMHGGSERSTSEVREAIRLGVVKINFNTCLRHAWRLGLENTFKENPGMLQSYKLLARSCALVKEVVKEKVEMIRRAS